LRAFVADLFDPTPEAAARIARGYSRRLTPASVPVAVSPRAVEKIPSLPRSGATPDPIVHTTADARLAGVDLDQWVSEPERAALIEAGWSPPGSGRISAGTPGRAHAGARTDVGQ